MKVKIPYGKSFQKADINDSYKCDVIYSNLVKLSNSVQNISGIDIVKKAMDNPIDSPKLDDLAKNADTCTIIISDHTRPVPSKDILPNMLSALRAGNKNIDITLLVATGFHRSTTKDELKAKVGDEIFNNEKFVVHDCRNKDSNVNLGTLPSGAPFVVDKLAANTDLLISEGFVEPHFFAGFSGGRKSVLPGVCDKVTVMANHNGQFIDSPFSRTGILENNPIHKDMLYAASLVNLKYIVNVIIDDKHNTVSAFAGNYKTAHEKACDYLRDYAEVNVDKYDIVITGNGGSPLDQNVYQCVKSCTAAEVAVKTNGIIINCSECIDGHGGKSFYEQIKNCKSVEELEQKAINTPLLETAADQWEYQILSRILKNNKVIFVADNKVKNIINNMKMTYMPTLQNAIDASIDIIMQKGINNPKIAVIPNGVSVICKTKTNN